jgi:hypothetical protein
MNRGNRGNCSPVGCRDFQVTWRCFSGTLPVDAPKSGCLQRFLGCVRPGRSDAQVGRLSLTKRWGSAEMPRCLSSQGSGWAWPLAQGQQHLSASASVVRGRSTVGPSIELPPHLAQAVTCRAARRRTSHLEGLTTRARRQGGNHRRRSSSTK